MSCLLIVICYNVYLYKIERKRSDDGLPAGETFLSGASRAFNKTQGDFTHDCSKIRIEEFIEIQHSHAVIALFHIMQQKTLILTLICRFWS